MSKSRRIHDVPDDIFLTFNSRIFGLETAPIKITKDEQEWLLNSSVFGTAMYESKLFFSYFYGFWPNSEVYLLDDIVGKCLRATRDLEKNDLIAGYYGFLRLYETAERTENFDTHSLKISEKLIYDGSIAAASSSDLPGFQFFGTYAKHSKKHSNSQLDIHHAYKGIPCYFLRASKNIAKGDQILSDYRHDKKFNDNREAPPFINFCPCEICYIPQQSQANIFNRQVLTNDDSINAQLLVAAEDRQSLQPQTFRRVWHEQYTLRTPQQFELTNANEQSAPPSIHPYHSRNSLQPQFRRPRHDPYTLRTPQQWDLTNANEHSVSPSIHPFHTRQSLQPQFRRPRHDQYTLRTPQQSELTNYNDHSISPSIHPFHPRQGLQPQPFRRVWHEQYTPRTPQQCELANANEHSAPPSIHPYHSRNSLQPQFRRPRHDQYSLRTPQQWDLTNANEHSVSPSIHPYHSRNSLQPQALRRPRHDQYTLRTPQQSELTNYNEDSVPPLIIADSDPVQDSYPIHNHEVNDDGEFLDENDLVTDDINQNLEILPSQFMTMDARQGLGDHDYQL